MIALALALAELRVVVLPVIAPLFLSTFFVPPTRWLRRRGWPSALSAVTVMAATLLAPPQPRRGRRRRAP